MFSQLKNNLLLPTLTVLLLAANGAFAQLAIKMELNQQVYLQFEPVFAKINLRNFSGHPLIFGANQELKGRLSFAIFGPGGTIINAKEGDEPSLTGMLLEPGKSKDIIVQVSLYYPFYAIGRYSVKAMVSHPQLANSFQSNTVAVTVSKGMPVWEHLFGVPQLIPDPQKVNAPIQERLYKIYSLYDGAKNYFYLVVEDKDMVYGIQRIGVEMSRSRPVCEVDRLSRLHILVSTNPRVFSYFVFDPDGKQEKRAVYRKTTSTPTLVRNPETGEVLIVGGEEARKDVDYEEDPGTRPTTAEKPEIQAAAPEPENDAKPEDKGK